MPHDQPSPRPDEATYALDPTTETDKARMVEMANGLNEHTGRLMRQAGLREGMRVLDLGSGPGDVAIVAATIVGPTGHVVGAERDPSTLQLASKRIAELGLGHVEFVNADVTQFDPGDRAFDAIVGRLILQYLPDPAAVLKRLVAHLRPGGCVVFTEADIPTSDELDRGFSAAPMFPRTPTADKVGFWAGAQVRYGSQPHMGQRLPEVFHAAGLIDIQASAVVNAGCGPEAIRLTAATIRSLVPGLIANGIATAEEIDIDTLADRLSAEGPPYGHTVTGLLYGAVARAPGA